MRPAGLSVVALLVAAALTGCGADTNGDQVRGRTLTVYVSVPMQGASRVEAAAVVDGARLALAEDHGRVGRYRVVIRALDDSTVQRGEWDPGQTSANAHLAAQDRSTIGYVGELNSGASAVSIPVLNRAGIVQISPSSTAVGLTRAAPGASPGEPQKYYPTGVRTFARIVPNDAAQAVAQVRLQRSFGCRQTYVLDDGEVDGADTATSFSVAAQAAGLPVGAVQAFDTRASTYSSLAAAVSASHSDCVLISAITENNAVLLTRQLAELLPSVLIFATAAMAESTYADPRQGGIPRALDSRVLITVASHDGAAYPEGGRRFLAGYQRAYGPPQPYAIYGYEAMSLLLDAISRATRGGSRAVKRSAVRSAVFATRDRHGALGTYSIEPDGDTTLRTYGIYRIVAGQLFFWKAIDV